MPCINRFLLLLLPKATLWLWIALRTTFPNQAHTLSTTTVRMSIRPPSSPPTPPDTRRSFVSRATTTFLSIAAATTSTTSPPPALAVGPVRVDLVNVVYRAEPCPKNRPIPGEKAMKGMRGLCVTVEADLKENSPKDLVDVGVYGFVTDAITEDSVLANNPDLSTDAGQFAIVPSITTATKSVTFDFVAAVPMEKDISKFENGIGELSFKSLRVVSFPGGQQYGGISPCEMDEFSMECEDWEEVNGPYKKKAFMVKSNERTKGR